jgi:hypothetical protein
MLDTEKCFKYEPEIKRVTKANSLMVDGRVVYIVKKDHTGKSICLYVAYDKETKIQLGYNEDKQALINYLLDKDLSCFGNEGSLF